MGCVGDGYYLVNGEGADLRIARNKNFDGPTVWKDVSMLGNKFTLPFQTSKTERYSMTEYLQVPEGEVSTEGGSSIGEALICLVPIIGWAMCASSCGGDKSLPPLDDFGNGEMFLGDIYADVPLETQDVIGEHADGEVEESEVASDGVENIGEVEEAVAEDITEIGLNDLISELTDAVEDVLMAGDLPNYEVPSNAEETWQSSYELLGLCLNNATSCEKAPEASCWEIQELNGSKPNTLALLDPNLDHIDIKLAGGPYNESEIYAFERIEAGSLMNNGYFDSVIWLAPGMALAADYVGETVDIMLGMQDYNMDLSTCEYLYNYPCPGTDNCN